MNTVIASHRPVSSRLHVRPLVASLGLALVLGAADCAIAQPELAAGLNANRPWSGVPGPLRGPSRQAPVTTNSQHSRAPTGGTLVVQNCADSGAGSLRDTIASAPDGATIEFGELACSTITLTSGAIAIAQQTLHIEGPGRDALRVDGSNLASVFRHSFRHGELSIQDLTVANGLYDSPPQYSAYGGGCIFSAGNLALARVTVENCVVTADTSQNIGTRQAGGGGVLAYDSLSLEHTIVRNCHVNLLLDRDNSGARGGGVAAFGYAYLSASTITNSHISGNSVNSVDAAKGGGIFASGKLTLTGSTVEDNQALSTEGDRSGRGGGVYHLGALLVQDSTISANHAGMFGGLCTKSRYDTHAIINSTVSGNHSDATVAGVYCYGHDHPCVVSNSTVAFNEAESASFYSYNNVAGGIVINGVIELQSVVIAGNEADGSPADLSLRPASSVTGAGNLIFAPASQTPTGTIVGADPLLGPLASNGGPTATHALLPGSPALDAGNNDAGLANDQRGTGFPRVVGTSADIGALEQRPDPVFHNGFE